MHGRLNFLGRGRSIAGFSNGLPAIAKGLEQFSTTFEDIESPLDDRHALHELLGTLLTHQTKFRDSLGTKNHRTKSFDSRFVDRFCGISLRIAVGVQCFISGGHIGDDFL